MSLQTNPSGSRATLQAIRNAEALFSDMNKAEGVNEENLNTQVQDEFESSLKEEDIIALVRDWKKTYSTYYEQVDKAQKLAFDYWLGKHQQDFVEMNPSGKNDQSLVDNLIFEAVETFLPIATRANPDPLVSGDPAQDEVTKAIKAALVHEADRQKIRRILARMVRHWAWNMLGSVKIIWDSKTKQIITENVNSRRLIFDKDGHIDVGGNFIGEYIGEKKQATAATLVTMFPKSRADIEIKAEGKMGTKIEYYEWWYHGTDVFFTMDDHVLFKGKNPNWNYNGDVVTVDPMTKEESTNQVDGTNHHLELKPPYVFLSVFSAGLHPHDDTSLILQNIPIQNLINRRWRQIDQNVQSQNNGLIVNGGAFTDDQAAQASSFLRSGGTIRVPSSYKDINTAVKRDAAPQLPSDIYQNLQDGRNELRNIFGTSGSTPEGLENQKTVRGKIMTQQSDSSRIGGGVTEQIEQVADTIYNWWVQFMFVYYDEEHFITTAGSQGGMEIITIKNTMFQGLKSLDITVKEGSLIPKDPLTQRNEAIDLWSAGAIDPLNFYKKLDFADPAQATNQLILWQMLQKGQIQPQQYLPSFAVAQMPQVMGTPGVLPQQGVGGPAVNNLDASNQPQVQPLGSPQAVSQESQQLLGSVPLGNI